MRTTIAIATFLAVGAGAVGVSALNLKGSDTLKEITLDLLALTTTNCGGTTQGGTLGYDGSGSGNGQAALTALQQQVAPMSRAFNNGAGICKNAAINAQTAEGIVFALDGLAVTANATNWGTCNGAVDNTCTQQVNLGTVSNKTITPDATRSCALDSDCNTAGIVGETCGATGVCQYVIPTWKEALRIIFAGHSVPTSDSANRNVLAKRNCASPERKWLAAHWNDVFQSCSSGACPNGIQHAFRRNDESGTTDVFVSLLQLPSITQGSNISPFCNVGTAGPVLPADGTCTIAGFGAQTAADANSGPFPAPPAGNTNLNPPTDVKVLNAAGTAVQYRGEHWTDMQDADVIRRTCAGTGAAGSSSEDVCEARGDLGLVLPIFDLPETVPQTDAFPTKACTGGKFVCISTPNADKCPEGSLITANPLCPSGSCAFPATAYPTAATCTTDAQCGNGTTVGACVTGAIGKVCAGTCNVDADCATATTSPAPPGICKVSTHTCQAVLDPRCITPRSFSMPGGPAKFDGRVFNLTSFTTTATFGQFPRVLVPRSSGMNPPCTNAIVANVPMVGSYNRIHSVHSLNTENGSAALCKTNSSTEQIGCLVQASPCSIGYAGRGAIDVTVNGATTGDAIALKVNGVDPANQCVRNLIANAANPAVGALYPISRKLYLNTIKGFGNVTGDELKLSDCFAQRSVVDPIATNRGFVTLSASASTQETFCEDFNEVSTCAGVTGNLYTGTNVDACHDAPTNPSPIPDCELTDTPGTGGTCDHVGG